MARQATEIKVYWDNQDRNNEGWAYRLSDSEGDIDSGRLNSADCDLYGAVEEAISVSGLELEVNAFAREPHVDGGYAIWKSDE